MMAALKAEFRKLFTVRSTYVILSIALIIEIFFAFYASGYKADASALQDPGMLASQVTSAISLLSTFVALIGVLLLSHEYRYNTILYTLTASRNRSRVFLAKVLVITIFSVVMALALGALSPLLTILGAHVAGHTIGAQTFPVMSLLWRGVFAGWGFAMFALIITFIVRIQIGSVAAIFLIPGTVEQLLGILLKHNQSYLPYTSLDAVLNAGHDITYGHAALTALAYVVIGYLVAWQLFLRRDAN